MIGPVHARQALVAAAEELPPQPVPHRIRLDGDGKTAHVSPKVFRQVPHVLVAFVQAVGGRLLDDGAEGFVDFPMIEVFDGREIAGTESIT